MFPPEKIFLFPGATRSFKYEGLPLLFWLCYPPNEDASNCSSLFNHDFPTKASRVKNLFSQPFNARSSAHLKSKNKKIDPSHDSVQRLHLSVWTNLEAILSEVKGSSHKINLLCDTKCKHELEEKRKVLAPIIDKIITLGRLGLPFRGHCDYSKYHPKAGEYSIGRVVSFEEFLHFRVRRGDKVPEQHLKTL